MSRVICFGILIAALLSGCVSVPDKQWSQTKGPESPEGASPASQLMLIEIDEQGKFFDPLQFDRMQEWLKQDDSPILLFVHGWHHNAQPGDQNLKRFKEFLAQVQTKVGRPVKGIYVGWRGDSLDPVIPISEPAGDFLTIFGRKKASVRIGKGDLHKIVDFMGTLGEDRNVVLMGHSLGGSALYYAAQELITKPLNDHTEVILLNPALGAKEVSSLPLPASSGNPGKFTVMNLQEASEQDDTHMKSVRSVNAAAATLGALVHANRRLVAFQAKGDWAIGFLFRFTGYGTPLGFDDNRITHESCAGDLGRCDRLHRGMSQPMVQFTSATGDSVQISPDGCTMAFANRKFFIKADRGKNHVSCRTVNINQAWVVLGDRSVSSSHNDIMNPIQADAVSSLIAWRLNPSSAPGM